jgi:TolA-binding protein
VSAPRHPVPRWTDGGEGDALDREIGEILRKAREPEALSKRELAMVALRLDDAPPRGASSRPRYATLLAIGMLSGTGVAVAGFGVARLVERAQVQRSASERLESPRAPAPPPSPRVGVPPAPPSAVVPTPDLVSLPAEAPEPSPRPPSGATLSRETELLAPALAALRRERAPDRALTLLDAYAREFPNGALSLEAASARVDTLLALGRASEALALIDRLPLARMPRKKELSVIAAELRATTDPARAISDYRTALSLGLSGALEERALYGMAGSRLRSGDDEGARRDLGAYLVRFPEGRFAGEARARLQTMP